MDTKYFDRSLNRVGLISFSAGPYVGNRRPGDIRDESG